MTGQTFWMVVELVNLWGFIGALLLLQRLGFDAVAHYCNQVRRWFTR